MLYGGFGCDADYKNCSYDQVPYKFSPGASATYANFDNIPWDMLKWEMPNDGFYKTIDSNQHLDSGFLVHSHVFNCKGKVKHNMGCIHYMGGMISQIFSYN